MELQSVIIIILLLLIIFSSININEINKQGVSELKTMSVTILVVSIIGLVLMMYLKFFKKSKD